MTAARACQLDGGCVSCCVGGFVSVRSIATYSNGVLNTTQESKTRRSLAAACSLAHSPSPPHVTFHSARYVAHVLVLPCDKRRQAEGEQPQHWEGLLKWTGRDEALHL